MEINLKPSDTPLVVNVVFNGKTVRILISPDRFDQEVDVTFFRTSVDLLRLDVAHPEVRIPAYEGT